MAKIVMQEVEDCQLHLLRHD